MSMVDRDMMSGRHDTSATMAARTSNTMYPKGMAKSYWCHISVVEIDMITAF